jgi:hypothetical protein
MEMRTDAAPTIAAAPNFLSATHRLTRLSPYTALTEMSVQRELAVLVI